MSEKVKAHLRCAVNKELDRAKEKYGETFVDGNHAYGVLAEEMHELNNETKALQELASIHFKAVMEEDVEKQKTTLRCMRFSSECLLLEAVQVNAMIIKALESIGELAEFKEVQNG